MGKIYIHVGWPKTGSTAIQVHLRDYAEQLKEAGIYAPPNVYDPRDPKGARSKALKKIVRGRSHSLIHGELGGLTTKQRAHGKLRPEDVEGAFENTILAFEESGCHTMILSKENLFWRSMGIEADKFPKRLYDHELHGISYSRRYDKYYLSLYRQMVKAGAIVDETLTDFVKHRRREVRNGAHKPITHAKKFQEDFGIPIIQRDYDDVGMGLIPDLMRIIGAPDDLDKDKKTSANPSFTEEQALFLMELQHRGLTAVIAKRFRRQLQRLNLAGRLDMQLPKVSLMDPEMRVKLVEEYNVDMADLCTYLDMPFNPIDVSAEKQRRRADRLTEEEFDDAVRSLPDGMAQKITTAITQAQRKIARREREKNPDVQSMDARERKVAKGRKRPQKKRSGEVQPAAE